MSLSVGMSLAVFLVVVSVGVALAVLPPGGTFTDDNGNVHEPNIEAIAAEGITKGCNPPANTLYCPSAKVNRGQMAAFLNRALNLPATDKDFFFDDDGTTFEADINRLAAAGITLGCNPPANTKYCPSGNVSRGQMAAFLVRGFGYTDDGGGNLFTDTADSIFKVDIDRLATAGVTLGCNPPANTKYCPGTAVLRDQMASFLARARGLKPIVPPPVEIPVGGKVPGQDLWALVPGNDLSADRVNLVFAPWGWDNYEDFVDLASKQLSWSSDAYLVAADRTITDDPSKATGAQMGLFSIEPWLSSRDRFNVWYTNVVPSFPAEWLNTPDHPFRNVPNVSVITLARDAHISNPDLTSVSGTNNVFVGPGAPVRPSSGNPFANSLAVIKSDDVASGLSDVPHELGHALFNLADEYVGQRFGYDGRTNLSSWPTCAKDFAEAGAWWGDLIGQVDPMVGTWASKMALAGFTIDEEYYEDQVKVANVAGGCYAVDTSARATLDSLMNNNIPVLGSVNRRWSQQILDLWTGTPRP